MQTRQLRIPTVDPLQDISSNRNVIHALPTTTNTTRHTNCGCSTKRNRCRPTRGRNTALMEMAGEMPAAVITRMLGISLNRATRWTQDASNTRPAYAADLARREDSASCSSRADQYAGNTQPGYLASLARRTSR